MKGRFFLLVAIIMVALLLMGATYPEVYFNMVDPTGDEHGYGSYQYPSNIAFKPFQGLFDITEFKVWTDYPGKVHFDTTFGIVTNPWVAPEGYIHQNLRIYIDNIPESGGVELAKKGARVTFNPKYAWDYCLVIAGWGNSKLIKYENGTLVNAPLATELLGDKRTIRATLPVTQIGKPDHKWNYYVFVGSYDGFGEDFFRRVAPQAGEWVIGGGNPDFGPRVMDLVAFEKGKASQERQLKTFSVGNQRFAQLEPVGKQIMRAKFYGWVVTWVVTLLLIAGLFVAYQFIGGEKRIFWFWVNQPKRIAKND